MDRTDWVNEDADDGDVTLGPTRLDERQVAIMQIAHRRHESDPFVGLTRFKEGMAKLSDRPDCLHIELLCPLERCPFRDCVAEDLGKAIRLFRPRKRTIANLRSPARKRVLQQPKTVCIGANEFGAAPFSEAEYIVEYQHLPRTGRTRANSNSWNRQ